MNLNKIIRNSLTFLAALSHGILSAAAYSVPEDPAQAEPLAVGERVPEVTVHRADGSAVSLPNLLADDPAVLIFYRGGWCPYCNTHLSAVGQAEEAIQAEGYRIYAISPDRVEKVATAAEEATFGYTLLSDSGGAAARAFGLAFTVDDDTHERLLGFGIDLEEASGEKHRQLPVPAIYIIDADGQVVFRHYDPDYRERLSTEGLLEALAE